MKKELIDEMQKLGLNNYEAKVYLALQERKMLTVSEVSKISQVPRVRTYDILDRLVTRGLASLRPGKYMKYSATDFDTLRDNLIDQIDKGYAEEKKNIENVTLTLKRQLESTIKERNIDDENPIDYIEIIKDPFQIHKRYVQLCSKATKEVLAIDKPPYSAHHKRKEQHLQQEEILRKGITIKAIYELSEDEEEKKSQLLEMASATKRGEKAKIIDKSPMKMAIFDGKIAIFTMRDPFLGTPSTTTVVVHHSDLAKGLKMLFEMLWMNAEDYHVLEDKGEKNKG